MVILHVKKTETDQFLFQTTTQESIDNLIRQLVQVWNMRIIISRLGTAGKELAQYGPSKPEHLRGLDDDGPGADAARALADADPKLRAAAAAAGGGGAAAGGGEVTNKDPSGFRVGIPPAEAAAATLTRTCDEAMAAVSKDQVARRQALSVAALQEHIDHIRAAVTICYPGGLPEFDPVRMMLEAEAEADLAVQGEQMMDPATATLWFAGKEFTRDQVVGDRVRNEKSKIVAKLQARGAGPPVREPAISAAERQAMMARYFKRQEELKQMEQDNDDSHLSAAWSDQSSLKSSLTGVGAIRFR